MRSCLALTLVAASSAFVALAPPATAGPSARPHVTITSSPRESVEGDRISFGIKVSHPSQAKKVQLQERVADIFGNPGWVVVGTQRVGAQPRHAFKVTSDGPNKERYRAAVIYGKGHRSVSKAVSVKVWRWIPLQDFDDYYKTDGILEGPYLPSFNMNGKAYNGWSTYGSHKYWETRYTPGRNCRALRADLGVLDNSQDGSSATISFLTDDGTPLFTSDSLTPGMVQPVAIGMGLPYRFWVQATDTSAAGLSSYPAMGDPEFLCTGM